MKKIQIMVKKIGMLAIASLCLSNVLVMQVRADIIMSPAEELLYNKPILFLLICASDRLFGGAPEIQLLIIATLLVLLVVVVTLILLLLKKKR